MTSCKMMGFSAFLKQYILRYIIDNQYNILFVGFV